MVNNIVKEQWNIVRYTCRSTHIIVLSQIKPDRITSELSNIAIDASCFRPDLPDCIVLYMQSPLNVRRMYSTHELW